VHFFGANFRTVATKKKPWVNYTKAVYERKKEKNGKILPFFRGKKSHLTIYRQ
jgi:hypothetical protein